MKNAFSKIASVRASVRPSGVQKPIALVLANFASPKVRGSKNRQIPFELFFRPPIDRFILAKSDRYQKAFFFCGIYNSAYISCCVAPNGGQKILNTAGIDSARAWRKAREFFTTPFFWISFVKGDFEKRIFQFRVRACMRPCVRPSVRPEAHSARFGRFGLTKNGGF